MRKTVFLTINSLQCGGAERVIANLSKALQLEYNVYVILLYPQTDEDYEAGGQIIVLDDGKKRNRLGQMLFFKRELEKYAKKYQPQSIVSFLLNACLCNILANTHAKKILSIRNYLKKQFKGIKLSIWEFCFKFLFKKADMIVSVSNQMKQDMIKEYGFAPEKSTVIYNPYYTRDIVKASMEPMEEEYMPLFSHQVIISLGNVGRQKGHCHLIRAFAELKHDIDNIKLVIIGKCSNIDYVKKVKQLVKDLRMENDVVLLGYRQNPHKYLRCATVFVFPSLYEGFPNALVEAMICGLPLVAADCKTGPREILAPDTENKHVNEVEECEYGLLVPSAENDCLDSLAPLTQDEILMIKAMKELLTNVTKRKHYIKKSLERGSMFALENIIGKWKEIL